MSQALPPALRRLAKLYGIHTAYRDVGGRVRPVTEAAVRGLVACLEPEFDRDAGDVAVAAAVTAAERDFYETPVQPVTVAWDGHCRVEVRFNAESVPSALRCRLVRDADPTLEEPAGEAREWSLALNFGTHVRTRRTDVGTFVTHAVTLEGTLPAGYHELTLEAQGFSAETLILSAPTRAWSPAGEQRLWGVFAPLYAVQTERSWGHGDVADLERLIRWTDRLGGDLVATLPLLPPQGVHSEDPSPYSPGSRMFWNDLYLDVESLPEVHRCPAVRERLESDAFRAELAALREGRHVDYDAAKRLRKEVLHELAGAALASDTTAMDDWADANPHVREYARFQAACEHTGKTFYEWPGGAFSDADVPAEVYRRHLYGQFRIGQQLERLGGIVHNLDMVWYLDYPLGVAGAGYDVWKHRGCFLMGASGGAPPDAFFTKGQNWGFPPMHPRGLRGDRYRYFLMTVRHHLRSAKLLRFDHVMGLFRLFCIPHGHEGRDGAYVGFPLDELAAALCIESHRAKAQIVGENLGTVPAAVDEAMGRHNFMGMSVLQFNVTPGGERPVDDDFERDVTSVNTHDTPTFQAYLTGGDIDDRIDLGLMTTDEAEGERAGRRIAVSALRRALAEADAFGDGTSGHEHSDLVEAALRYLGRSNAPVVLTSLDDLLYELAPQNTPGTYLERPNWRRKLAAALETMEQDEPVLRRLRALAEARAE